MDPLVLLRDCYSGERKISLFNAKANEIICEIDLKQLPGANAAEYSKFTHILTNTDDGKNVMDRSVATAFKSKRGTDAAYSVDACLVCLWYESTTYKDYLQACRKDWSGVQTVSLVDRKDLLAYLTGKVESSAYLDPMAPLVPFVSKSSVVTKARRPTAADMISEATEGKKPKTTETSTSVAKAPFKEQDLLQELRRISKPEKSIESLLLVPGKNFKDVVLGVTALLKDSSTSRPSSSSTKEGKTSATPSSFQASGRDKKKATIIVPASMTSLLNLYNIKSFLQDQKFVTVEEAKKVIPAKPQSVTITHGGIVYRVVDSVHRFQKSDWDSVVAVIVQGPAWQFKGWKWDTPVEIFTHIKGFFIHFEDAPIDPIVKGWDIARLPIGRQKRHLDKQAVFQFWESLQ